MLFVVEWRKYTNCESVFPFERIAHKYSPGLSDRGAKSTQKLRWKEVPKRGLKTSRLKHGIRLELEIRLYDEIFPLLARALSHIYIRILIDSALRIPERCWGSLVPVYPSSHFSSKIGIALCVDTRVCGVTH